MKVYLMWVLKQWLYIEQCYLYTSAKISHEDIERMSNQHETTEKFMKAHKAVRLWVSNISPSSNYRQLGANNLEILHTKEQYSEEHLERIFFCNDLEGKRFDRFRTMLSIYTSPGSDCTGDTERNISLKNQNWTWNNKDVNRAGRRAQV